MDFTEKKNDLYHLPPELLLKISDYLEFSDIWYFGTCSRYTRELAYRLLNTKYQIDLIQPRIISPFSQLMHGAVAFLGRYGYKTNLGTGIVIDHAILQSVANHMVIAMHDRVPTKIGRSYSLDFILDKTLGVLIDHSLNDPTLRITFCSHGNETTIDPKFMEDLQIQQHQQDDTHANVDSLNDNYNDNNNNNNNTTTTNNNNSNNNNVDIYTATVESTGILLVDYLATLYPTLTALFDTECTHEIHHRLLIGHINRQLDQLRNEYHQYHHHRPSIKGLPELNFCLFIQFLCALIKTNLVTASDINNIVQHRVSFFFLTQPSDVTLTDHGSLVLKKVSNNNNSEEYQWKLWLKEIQLRLKVLIDLMKALIRQHYGDPSELLYVNAILQETSRVFSMSRLVNREMM